jgi:hypothetical protein
MMRRILIAAFVLLAFVPGVVAAQDTDAEETGTISGVVTNGTEDGGDVTGIEVVLQRFVGMDPVEEYTTTIAEAGSYEFTDLPIQENEAYLATVVYDGVAFRSGMILLTQEPDTERDITVYERTDDRSVLRIISRGVVIAGADSESGLVEVLEIIALENTSDRVFVGDENGEVLRLAMPEDATDISPQAGFNFGQLFVDGNVLVSTGSVNPGSHNPMISYQIPYSGTSGTLRVGTAMETGTLRVLVEEGTYDISSSVLSPAGQTQVGSADYDVLAIDNPVVGDIVTVRISGLPRENWNLPVDMSTFLASIAAGVGLVIGAVLIYQVVHRRQVVADTGAGSYVVNVDEDDPDDLESQRRALAAELNKLESDFDRGEIDDETFQRKRDDVLAELREISLRMRGLEE